MCFAFPILLNLLAYPMVCILLYLCSDNAIFFCSINNVAIRFKCLLMLPLISFHTLSVQWSLEQFSVHLHASLHSNPGFYCPIFTLPCHQPLLGITFGHSMVAPHPICRNILLCQLLTKLHDISFAQCHLLQRVLLDFEWD